MDRKRKKKIRDVRVAITNIFMGISVVAIVFVLMLIAMGFSFNKSGELEQSGLVQLNSTPDFATVEIDDITQFSRTKISKMLSKGVHTIKITKSGYDSWVKNLDVEAGLLTDISWARLFPLQPEISDVSEYKAPRLISYASDRKSMLILEENSDNALLVNAQSNRSDVDKIAVSELLSTNADSALEGNLSVLAWSRNANRILLKWERDGVTTWHLADLKSPKNSINLSSKLAVVPTQILFANDTATNLWITTKGSLYFVDTSALKLSEKPIATGVELIANNGDTVAYVATTAATTKENLDTKNTNKKATTKNAKPSVEVARGVYLYNNGETGSTLIDELEDSQKASIKLALGTYWSKDWLAYSVDETMNVLEGLYPSFEKPNSSALKVNSTTELGFIPTMISVNDLQRIILTSNGLDINAIDLETNKNYHYVLDDTLFEINWLDSYLIWQQVDDKIFVRDFDGDNLRELFKDVTNDFGIMLSENNNWIYRFDTRIEAIEPQLDEDGQPIVYNCPADIPADATHADSPNCVPDVTYILQREKLRI